MCVILFQISFEMHLNVIIISLNQNVGVMCCLSLEIFYYPKYVFDMLISKSADGGETARIVTCIRLYGISQHVSVFSVIKNWTCDHLSFTAGDEKWMNLLSELSMDLPSLSIQIQWLSKAQTLALNMTISIY